MKNVFSIIFLILVLFSTFSCQTGDSKSLSMDRTALWKSFDQKRYEGTTKIILPKEFIVLDQGGNDEFFEMTIFKLNKNDRDSFLIKNGFRPMGENRHELRGLNYMDSSYQNLSDRKHLFFVFNAYIPKSNDIGWLYIYDTLTDRLYCRVQFPDPGGT